MNYPPYGHNPNSYGYNGDVFANPPGQNGPQHSGMLGQRQHVSHPQPLHSHNQLHRGSPGQLSSRGATFGIEPSMNIVPDILRVPSMQQKCTNNYPQSPNHFPTGFIASSSTTLAPYSRGPPHKQDLADQNATMHWNDASPATGTSYGGPISPAPPHVSRASYQSPTPLIQEPPTPHNTAEDATMGLASDATTTFTPTTVMPLEAQPGHSSSHTSSSNRTARVVSPVQQAAANAPSVGSSSATKATISDGRAPAPGYTPDRAQVPDQNQAQDQAQAQGESQTRNRSAKNSKSNRNTGARAVRRPQSDVDRLTRLIEYQFEQGFKRLGLRAEPRESERKDNSPARTQRTAKSVKVKIEPPNALAAFDQHRSAILGQLSTHDSVYSRVDKIERGKEKEVMWITFKNLSDAQAFKPNAAHLTAATNVTVTNFVLYPEFYWVRATLHGKKITREMIQEDSGLRWFEDFGIYHTMFKPAVNGNAVWLRFTDSTMAWKLIETAEQQGDDLRIDFCSAKIEAVDVRLKPFYCYKCYEPGHMENQCNQLHSTCGKCAGQHKTSECAPGTKFRCPNCGDEHPAWSPQCQDSERMKMLARCATFGIDEPFWARDMRQAQRLSEMDTSQHYSPSEFSDSMTPRTPSDHHTGDDHEAHARHPHPTLSRREMRMPESPTRNGRTQRGEGSLQTPTSIAQNPAERPPEFGGSSSNQGQGSLPKASQYVAPAPKPTLTSSRATHARTVATPSVPPRKGRNALVSSATASSPVEASNSGGPRPKAHPNGRSARGASSSTSKTTEADAAAGTQDNSSRNQKAPKRAISPSVKTPQRAKPRQCRRDIGKHVASPTLRRTQSDANKSDGWSSSGMSEIAAGKRPAEPYTLPVSPNKSTDQSVASESSGSGTATASETGTASSSEASSSVRPVNPPVADRPVAPPPQQNKGRGAQAPADKSQVTSAPSQERETL
ncbi:uncharacterized protein CCOS01_11151 [Colletotrichum costaricense]|uniref:CCHC-type domain-containing protein n=1 Tax=Colletotrichum costaricense TaxID=1209916 RepID=A0AAI9YQI1_9PEZI|nr:uncharacterized protein CCOS01_11151 [Colletotrichum costaricense]KAK1519500.1 hypothetical protein CCOS01_11151 [Colletotrichum costaricense]